MELELGLWLYYFIVMFTVGLLLGIILTALKDWIGF